MNLRPALSTLRVLGQPDIKLSLKKKKKKVVSKQGGQRLVRQFGAAGDWPMPGV